MVTPKWKGPRDGGITYSLLSKFMGEDPYRLYLYFVLGLQEYEEPEPNLAYGDSGHYGLEHLIAKPYTTTNFTPEDWEEIYEAVAYKLNNEYPHSPPTFYHSLRHMLSLYDDSFKEEYGRFVTEVEFKVPYHTRLGHDVTLRGKIDSLQVVEGPLRPGCQFGDYELSQLPDGLVPGYVSGEHKFKGRIDTSVLRDEIAVDLQVSIYQYVAGTRLVIYDNIRIPDTQYSLPPKRQYQKMTNYIEELYFKRKWGDFPIVQNKHKWISQLEVPIEDEVIKANFNFTVEPVIDWICHLWEKWQDSNFDPENPNHYDRHFFRKPIRLFDASQTNSYKGRYYGLYTNQLDVEDLVPVEGFYNELKEE